MQETQIQSLDPEDPLEKEMENHFSSLTWRIPWTEEPGRLQSIGLQESDTPEQPTVETVGGPSESGELVMVCNTGLDLARRPS